MLHTKTFVPTVGYGVIECSAAGYGIAVVFDMSAQKTEKAWIVPSSGGMA
ncbi:hypothetical protein [Papillibacter cinnamivorans]|uniref:Uncharacterized protein n=1 Tax=Papillibacter cinnamivorans DSM 12816 TaxID=1122930 RepID=A0A1W2BVD4_9FIRM|nr:hypothetical protein [Papillibacter cinnamivorans]SMC76869.1 hypothetical protein SAMN02745168_2416 [Papillibacter cinnamivorans DSM 12816]